MKTQLFAAIAGPCLLVPLIACGAAGGSSLQPAPAAKSISPGTPWLATNGSSIQGHSGGIIKVADTYYWIGENKTNGANFYANSCYSSTDLVTWTFVNNTLSVGASGDLGPNRIIERPKIIYNSSTKTYVMYMHIDNASYGEAKVGVATSPTVCGNYTYLGSSQPLGFQSRDIGLFQDTDGSAYLLSEDRANGLRIDALSADYLSVAKAVAVLPDMEAPALVKVGSTYFIFCSQLTGWNTNDNRFATATSLAGPWTALTDFAPVGSDTFNSQTTYVLPVSGSAGTTYLYMGDRWVPADLATSTYIWLPLKISANSASMSWQSQWSVDVGTGTWSVVSASQPSTSQTH